MAIGQQLARMEARAVTKIREVAADAVGPDDTTLKKLGIFTPSELARAIKSEEKQAYLVDGILRKGSLNILVGDSGLGKTPLAMQLGLAVASGTQLFGRSVEQGPVLYCDSESDISQFGETLAVLTEFLGLKSRPERFLSWSPYWSVADKLESFGTAGDWLLSRVATVKPSLVIVDPLRTFWSEAEGKSADTAQIFQKLRKQRGTTWLVLHHRRKTNQQLPTANLGEDPHGWFQETAGSLALVNQSDSRLGVVHHPEQGDLLLGGFMRGTGPLPSLDLRRVSGNDGSPIGYELLVGANLLSLSDRTIFTKLSERFRFKDVRDAMSGNSDSNANRFLKKCISVQILKKEEDVYVKTNL